MPNPEWIYGEGNRYELFYSTGGHGGPYDGLATAKAYAVRLLKSNENENWVDIRQCTKDGYVQRLRVQWEVETRRVIRCV